jgi:hypothetical protein
VAHSGGDGRSLSVTVRWTVDAEGRLATVDADWQEEKGTAIVDVASATSGKK